MVDKIATLKKAPIMLLTEVYSIYFILSLAEILVHASEEATTSHDREIPRLLPSMTTPTRRRASRTSTVGFCLDETPVRKLVAHEEKSNPTVSPRSSVLRTPSLRIAKTSQKAVEPTRWFHVQRTYPTHDANRHVYDKSRSNHTVLRNGEALSSISFQPQPSQMVPFTKTIFLPKSVSSVIPRDVQMRSVNDCGKKDSNSCNTYVTRWVQFYVNVSIRVAFELQGLS